MSGERSYTDMLRKAIEDGIPPQATVLEDPENNTFEVLNPTSTGRIARFVIPAPKISGETTE